MEDRLLRRALDKELVDAVSRLKPTGAISNSQLSRLRIIARSALASARAAPSDKSPLQRLVVLFDEQDERSLRSTALAKYNKVRVAGTRLPRWIADLAQKPEMIWEVLDQSRRKPLVPGSMADGDLRDPDLAVEYTVRLIDGVLAAAMEGNR